MIAHLTGTILTVTDKYLIIETYGIGYRVFATAETLVKHKTGDTLSLWIAHIVREDSQDLYGFENQNDQDLFELLRSVSGIGPKSALGVMNVATIGTIARAINTNDVGYLTKISGIGKKTAEKIILELRDKLPAIMETSDTSSSHDVIDALIALGYSEPKAREAARSLDPNLDTQTKIREALKLLNK
jgi:Holliday junction DNA helicase RuvA